MKLFRVQGLGLKEYSVRIICFDTLLLELKLSRAKHNHKKLTQFLIDLIKFRVVKIYIYVSSMKKT